MNFKGMIYQIALPAKVILAPIKTAMTSLKFSLWTQLQNLLLRGAGSEKGKQQHNGRL